MIHSLERAIAADSYTTCAFTLFVLISKYIAISKRNFIENFICMCLDLVKKYTTMQQARRQPVTTGFKKLNCFLADNFSVE